MATKAKVFNLSLASNDVMNAVKSYQLSKKYVQRFLKIGPLNIIYRRIDVPESEFVPKTYENVSYMVFKRKSTNKFIRNYHVFTLGVIDAVERDYLKEIFLYIQDNTTDEILETYNFKVKYNKHASKSTTKPDIVRNATVDFFQALSNIPGEKWSSDKVELFMEFSYNEETPREYEPPNFEPAKKPFCITLHSNKIVNLGSVNTGFHKISVWGRGTNFTQSRASTPGPSALVEEETLDLEIDYQKDKQQKGPKRGNKDEAEHEVQKKKTKTDAARVGSPFNITDESILENVTIFSSEDYISCMCKWELSKEFETSRCTKCYGIVHLACHGYITLNAVDEGTFVCYTCTDPKANSLSMNRLIKLRIILYGIYLKKELPIELEMTSKEERNYIMGQLEKLGVYSSKAKGQGVNLQKLAEALSTAFSVENSQYLE